MNNIINKKTKIVIIGESGSGKSEFAINLALYIRKNLSTEVDFFDMDQTKPLFRSRDAKELLYKNQILFHEPLNFFDSPIVPHAIIETLSKENAVTIFDVGGNIFGALTMGQYSRYLQDQSTIVFYTINVYRCFSNTVEDIQKTMGMIKTTSNLKDIVIVSNPTYGLCTTDEEVIEGNKKLEDMLTLLGEKIGLVLVNDEFDLSKLKKDQQYFLLHPYLNYLK